MKYFLLLTLADNTCAGDITTCCKDYGLATYLHIVKEVLGIIHLVVPMILIVMVTIDFAKMVMNPDDPQKKKSKSIINKFIAAILIFFIPLIVNVIFSLIPNNISDISGCWKSADEVFNTMKNTKSHSSTIDKYKRTVNSSSGSNSFKTSSNGNDIAAYAQKFVGNKYKYGGTWDGEEQYTPTDCSGFTQGVYRHFGISLKRTAAAQYKQGTTVPSIAEAQPGDLLFYKDSKGNIGHVTMYIGHNQVVHASSSSNGVMISNVGYRKYFAIKRMI